jgi:CDP-diglyceride synthetase
VKRLNSIQSAILVVILLIGLAFSLALYFNDLPLLWTITLLVVVISVGIIGYILGYLFGKRKS